MTSNRLLQLSGIVVDLLYQVERVPRAGTEARVHGFEIAAGGGFNAMIAARRAGLDVVYGGPVGTGPFADIVVRALNADDIAFLHPQNPHLDQGCCSVLVDDHGERTFIASDGAEGTLTDHDMRQIDVARFQWCLLSGYSLSYPGSHAALTRWLQETQEISGLLFDPSPIVDTVPRDALMAALARATWISANAKEAGVLTGHDDPATAAVRLGAGSPAGGGAIVRDGANGCFLALAGQSSTHIPGVAVPVLDTNGAGDAHTGSFMARLAQGCQPIEAARYANAAAALSTTRRGPATAPQRSEVETVLGMPKRA